MGEDDIWDLTPWSIPILGCWIVELSSWEKAIEIMDSNHSHRNSTPPEGHSQGFLNNSRDGKLIPGLPHLFHEGIFLISNLNPSCCTLRPFPLFPPFIPWEKGWIRGNAARNHGEVPRGEEKPHSSNSSALQSLVFIPRNLHQEENHPKNSWLSMKKLGNPIQATTGNNFDDPDGAALGFSLSSLSRLGNSDIFIPYMDNSHIWISMLLSQLDDAPMDLPFLKSQEKPNAKKTGLPNPGFDPVPSSKLGLRGPKGPSPTWKLVADISIMEKPENSRSFPGKP